MILKLKSKLETSFSALAASQVMELQQIPCIVKT